jgi:predicted nucleic acid-binding protein
MGKVNAFKNKHVALDTMVLIHWFEGEEKYKSVIQKIIEQADQITLSHLALGEFLVPYQKSTHFSDMPMQLLRFLEEHPKFNIAAFGQSAALYFASIRAEHPSVKPPDAIHLATALSVGAELFISDDRRLANFPGLLVLGLESLA